MSDLFDYKTDVLPQQAKQFPELLRRLRETAKRLAMERGEITTDDVHDAMPIPDGVDPRILGGVFHPRKEWVRTGQRPSKRRDKNHGRWLSTWKLREEVAA